MIVAFDIFRLANPWLGRKTACIHARRPPGVLIVQSFGCCLEAKSEKREARREKRSSLLPTTTYVASARFDPTSSPLFRLASTNSSRSPSSTFCVSLRSTPVRRSLIRLWSRT